jgi:hypothetical protein
MKSPGERMKNVLKGGENKYQIDPGERMKNLLKAARNENEIDNEILS